MYSLKHQTGDFLVEAMIGALITALMSLGTLIITSRVLFSQEEMLRQETLVTEFRQLLYNHNPSDNTTIQCPGASGGGSNKKDFELKNRGKVSITASCPVQTETYRINGTDRAPVSLPLVQLSVKVPVPGEKDASVEYALGVKPP